MSIRAWLHIDQPQPPMRLKPNSGKGGKVLISGHSKCMRMKPRRHNSRGHVLILWRMVMQGTQAHKYEIHMCLTGLHNHLTSLETSTCTRPCRTKKEQQKCFRRGKHHNIRHEHVQYMRHICGYCDFGRFPIRTRVPFTSYAVEVSDQEVHQGRLMALLDQLAERFV